MIIKYPDERLMKTSKPTTVDKELFLQLKTICDNSLGIGLAAIQIGIPKRVFVMYDSIYMNPIILRKMGKVNIVESCLSIPNVQVDVCRADIILVKYQDEDGISKTRQLEGLKSVVFQHEFDHLNGRLILYYQGKSERVL